MGSPHLSRRSEKGFDRRQEHIQLERFPEGDELALLYLLLRELATGCQQDRGDGRYLVEAIIEFDAVHPRQPVIQKQEVGYEVPHEFQRCMALSCHERSVGRLLFNSRNKEGGNGQIILDVEDDLAIASCASRA